MKGKVLRFRDDKGYGFISSPERAGEIFVTFRDIAGVGYRSLSPDDEVEFDLVPDERKPGQMKAGNVRKAIDFTPAKEAAK